MLRSTLLLLVLLCASAPLRAQATPGTAAAIGTISTLVPAGVGTALWFADDDPSGPALIIASGLILGPAMGYWSAGMAGRGWKSFAIRAGLGVVSFVPAMAICGMDCIADDSNYDVAWVMIATGSGLGLFSAVHDLSRIKSNVERHRSRRGSYEVVPTYDYTTRAGGVRVTVRF
jgi:hypothetical protein